jgi:hypothetical protein
MDFEERLQKAVRRGQRRGDAAADEARRKQLSQEELKSLHTKYRLALSDHIENCIKRLPNHFPGFSFETIYGEKGWGAAVSRDDIRPGGSGRAANYFSRLEMTIRPFTDYHVLDLAAKGTIRNKEIYSRSHFETLDEADTDQYVEFIDLWVLEYAELFAAE